MNAARSTRAEVRNPVMALQAMKKMQAISPETRKEMRLMLAELGADARYRAEKCWRTHKAPMAAYWKAGRGLRRAYREGTAMSSTLFKFGCESDMHLTALCLRMAAEQFDRNVLTATEVPGPGGEGLARQFRDQATRARATATALEDGGEEQS